jgi:V8-like Glu-specific endopeptidase
VLLVTLSSLMAFGGSLEPSQRPRHDLPIDDVTAPATPPEIRGGRLAVPAEHEAVVALRAHLRICSGVMVSSHVLLTAAHCVADVGFGQQITMYHGMVSDDARRHQAASWAAHPGYCPDCREDWFDIGYVSLTLPYEMGEDGGGHAIPITTQDEWDEVMQEGRTLHVVGYGSDEPSDAGPRTKRVAEVELSDLTRSGREFRARSVDGRTGGGDSGGPYITTLHDGELRLVGIHSRTDHRDGAMIATPPLPALCWLREETGVDLLPSPTTDCTALDTGSAGCRIGPGAGSPFVLLGLLLALAPRRCRETAIQADP